MNQIQRTFFILTAIALSGCFPAGPSKISLPVLIDPRIHGKTDAIPGDQIHQIKDILIDRNGNIGGDYECRSNFKVIDFIESVPLRSDYYSAVLYKECDREKGYTDAGIAFLTEEKLDQYIDLPQMCAPSRFLRIPDINRNGIEEIGILCVFQEGRVTYKLFIYELNKEIFKLIGTFSDEKKEDSPSKPNVTILKFDGDLIYRHDTDNGNLNDLNNELPLAWEKIQLAPPQAGESLNQFFVWPVRPIGSQEEAREKSN